MAFDGVVFRTNAGLGVKWGNTGKGVNLTPAEVDDNFWELLSRLRTLEDNPPTAVSISNISILGTQMLFTMSDASTFGPFTLPVASFVLRGNYVAGTPYHELDIITVPGQGVFLVRIEHNGEDPFDPDANDGSGHLLYLRVFGEDSFIYDLGWFYPGRPGNGIEVDAAMAAHIFVRSVTLPVGLAGSKARLRVASDTALSFPLYKNATLIGSINFAIGALTATFTFTAAVTFAVDDVIYMRRPTAINGAARELNVSLIGSRAS